MFGLLFFHDAVFGSACTFCSETEWYW